ncbi:MAG: DUF5719 family protein [Acidimicrobiales bacterium]|nr:DUF5719 family protein [Acidimicrobiales bacterium]
MTAATQPPERGGSSARLSALVVLVGLIVGGLALQAAESDDPGADPRRLVAGVVMPAARAEPTLSSTWFCAGGSALSDGVGDHALLLANPTDRARTATITALTGDVAAPPAVDPQAPADPAQPSTTTTVAGTTSTVAPVERTPPVSRVVEVPAHGRFTMRLQEMVQSPLAGAVVEVEGGEIAVEHEITSDLGRATAPCSTTASSRWAFPWGVTERGARELLVFMNPFPDDATVDIAFATDEGVRDTLRFQGFVVPGRSVVGAYIDEDVQRRAHVSADIVVRGGRLVVDRIQTFDGTDAREGITLGLGAPAAAETWMFPDGLTGAGLTEQIVVFNPSDGVAEVEVEVRLDAAALGTGDATTDDTPAGEDPVAGEEEPAADPEATDGEATDEEATQETTPPIEPPEPFELTVPSGRYAILDLHAQERVPAGLAHSLFVRSLNGVPVVAERVVTAGEGSPRRGIGATLGSPLGASTWYFPGGGPSPARDEFITLLNVSIGDPVTFSITGLASGQLLAVQGLQDVDLPAGGRVSIRLGDHVEREDLPIVVTADGAVVAERGLYRVGGDGLSHSMGIPLGADTVVPDPVDG